MDKFELRICKELADLPIIKIKDIGDMQGEFKDLSETNFNKLLGLFKKYGFKYPLYIWFDKNGKAWSVDGQQRHRVINKTWGGEIELPYIKVSAKDRKAAIKQILALNSNYGTVTKEGFDFITGGFEVEDFKEIETDFTFDSFLDPEVEEAAEDGFVMPEEIETDIKLGDIFEIYKDEILRHKLMCGDSTSESDVSKLMGGEKADLYITDPSYGVSNAAKNKYLNKKDKGKRIETEIINDQLTCDNCGLLWVNTFKNAEKIMTDKASYYIFSAQGQDLMMMMMMMMIDKVFALKHCLIWVKNNHVLGRSDYNYKHEPLLFGWKKNGSHNFYGGFQTSVFEVDKPLKNDLHPTMKPIELLSKFIKNSSLETNLIYDSFLGSGSTMVASHQLNRKCFGMEISPQYCEVSIIRLLTLDNTLKIKKNNNDVTDEYLKKIQNAD